MPTDRTTKSYSCGQLSVVFAQILNDQVSAARDFLDLRHARTDIAHPEFLRPVVILLEALAEGAQVHEEDVALQTFVQDALWR